MGVVCSNCQTTGNKYSYFVQKVSLTNTYCRFKHLLNGGQFYFNRRNKLYVLAHVASHFNSTVVTNLSNLINLETTNTPFTNENSRKSDRLWLKPLQLVNSVRNVILKIFCIRYNVVKVIVLTIIFIRIYTCINIFHSSLLN